MKPDTASCVAGKFHIVAAACSTPDGRCPATRPVLGTACTGSRDELCLYTACGRDELAYCDGGKWSGKYGGCADTSHCPSTIPAVGEACTGAGSACMYTNSCGIATSRSCVDGKWSGPPVAPCETLPPCPTTQPANGDACTPPADFTMCVWKNSCGGVDYGACGWITGKATAWTIIRPACPAAACPTTPEDGAACTGTETCVYPLGGDCSLSCSCTSAKWVCKRSMCSRG